MKKKITISIPDNLNDLQEAKLIQERLNQKALTGSGKIRTNSIRIGDCTDIKLRESVIVIKRIPAEPFIETKNCTVCRSSFQSDMGQKMYINYGGRRKQLHYCSKECCLAVIEICGEGRAAMKKSELIPVRMH